ncbi:leucyl aminopeptidase family protein [uncultured Flavonifractor sp.]|uniref:leucyl aminopeptidase family protein n=1 Tax=uncultured Flavonifractor sp. TaxID=1193534 RepID=UPI00260C0760|nr:leucyl aminopeptidase [uncultured Flavonifractor sp.]
MIQRYQGQQAQWRLSFVSDSEKSMTLTPGDGPCTWTVHVGSSDELTPERLRRAAAKAVKTMKELGGKTGVLDAAPLLPILGPAAGAALTQGAELALHEAPSFATGTPKEPITLWLDGDCDGLDQALQESAHLTRSICLARDLVNCPANKLTPALMAEEMTREAEALGIQCQVLDEHQARTLGMEAFLTVGNSALHPPRLIVLRYRGGGDEDPICLVGKGVTCDTGGYCLKAASSMKGIKGDMAGAAAVWGAVLALAANHVPVNVTAVIPSVENRISPDSYIPGDVIGSMSGKTIEVGNTDAEGRLILADGVTYAIREEHAAKIVDIATLTGAVVGMFGFTTAGYLSNDDGFSDAFRAAYRRSGEQYWPLPTFPEYRKMIESPLADLSNTSSDGCGTITAGLFIGAFAEDKPWIHIDIAGTAWVDSPRFEYQTKGATGAGVTTLYELCKGYAQEV